MSINQIVLMHTVFLINSDLDMDEGKETLIRTKICEINDNYY